MLLVDQPDATRELVKVVLLRCAERVLLEEWDNHFEQIGTLSNDVPIQVFFMVVIAWIAQHLTDLEEVVQLLETRNAFRTLRHRELARHLISELAGCVSTSAGLPNDADGEAAFSVNKSRDPA